MSIDPVDAARRCFECYVEKDRAGLEALIAEDFHFTSPLDNRIDRATYFERCWPNSETMAGVDFIYLARDGERAFVTYEGALTTGKRIRNTEVFTVREGKVVSVEVYFGWNVPHKARDGGFVDPA